MADFTPGMTKGEPPLIRADYAIREFRFSGAIQPILGWLLNSNAMRVLQWIITAIMVGMAAYIGAFIFILPVSGDFVRRSCGPDDASYGCIMRATVMGHRYSNREDYSRAIEWYARAARLGDVSATFFLGWAHEQAYREAVNDSILRYYESGMQAEIEETPRDDLEAAARAYRQAAEAEYAPAMNNLGQLYSFGNFGEQRASEGFGWTLRAALLENPVASINVGLAYMRGLGVDRDPDAAERWMTWYAERANLGDVERDVLKRTTLYGGPMDFDTRWIIQEAAKVGGPATAHVRPLTPDPNAPLFEEVVAEQAAVQAGGR